MPGKPDHYEEPIMSGGEDPRAAYNQLISEGLLDPRITSFKEFSENMTRFEPLFDKPITDVNIDAYIRGPSKKELRVATRKLIDKVRGH